MQIHELTLGRKTQVDEGIASDIGGAVGRGIGAVKKVGTAIASPFRDVAAGYRTGKVDAKTASIADKAYRSWSAYRQQLDKTAPSGKADPATLEKQLMAFVSKNLLGGQYLPNLINKDEILGLVKQIATGGVTTSSATQQTPKQAPAKKASAKTGTRTGKIPSASKTKTPSGTGAFVQTAQGKQIKGTQGTVPSTPGGETVSIGGQKLNPKDPAQAELIKKAQAAAAKAPIQEAIAPAQELELFKKLVAATAQAQSQVDTGQATANATAGTGTRATPASNNARALAGQVAKVEKQGGVDPAVLAKAGKILQQAFKKGSPVIKKTGDAAVDALLLNMGFQL